MCCLKVRSNFRLFYRSFCYLNHSSNLNSQAPDTRIFTESLAGSTALEMTFEIAEKRS